MSNIARMMQRATAGAGGAGLDVDEVFSTFVHTSTGSALNIQNGVDLTEGGLIWIKNRLTTDGHQLFDTERGVNQRLKSEESDAEATDSDEITSFNSNGFTLSGGGATNNSGGDTYVSWTFRKAPKFFDVVKYVGNGSTQNISHNLGSVPGMMLVKCRDNGGNWRVFHTSVGNTKGGYLAETLAFDDDVYWNDTTPTSTVFTVGNKNDTNGNGLNYIAYLFAHNNSDGGFGPDSDKDIIKCGSFTGSSSSDVTVNVGFEPQWLLTFRTGGGNWSILDSMRGIFTGGNDPTLFADSASAENTGGDRVELTPTGFIQKSGQTGNETVIYMAIRRGPLAAPEDATKVFSVNETGTGDSPANSWPIGFETDMNIHTQTTGNSRFVMTRLLGGKYLKTNDTGVENTASGQKFWDSKTGQWDLHTNWWTTTSNIISWSWKRAPSYFDAVAYSGTNSATTISHNLGAVPEMIWVKSRANANRWTVFHKDQGPTKRAFLELTQAFDTGTVWNNTAPTSTVFSVGTDSNTNSSGHTFIAYLFATVAGVSKVGSVTHSSGSTTNVDCGFSSGARFVLVKSTAVGYWRVWDSVRGIVAGNDPYIHLNDTSAEVTNGDLIDPYSGGFALAPSFYTDTYIFYAIA